MPIIKTLTPLKATPCLNSPKVPKIPKGAKAPKSAKAPKGAKNTSVF